MGLSPRVRGNRKAAHCHQLGGVHGSIPARAGEPVASIPPRPSASGGLSPRVRGNLVGHPLHELADGSIPARAGEPTPRRQAASHRGVYPRACGGTAIGSNGKTAMGGLSPRVRGTQLLDLLVNHLNRSIPARAGEPGPEQRRRHPGEVYPRACGGTGLRLERPVAQTGLSPRVRGNPQRAHPWPALAGSIPARAGEPRRDVAGQRALMVYPRACGGTVYPLLLAVGMGGLSPRVRGNRAGCAGIRRRWGSIPARAGEPSSRLFLDRHGQVYPRACGGTCSMTPPS